VVADQDWERNETVVRQLAFAVLITLASASYVRADECDTVAASLGEQVPQMQVSDRIAGDQTVTVNLKHPDAAELSVTCTNNDVHETAELTARWDATWPPSRFYDLVAAAGAVVAAQREPAIRGGAVLCAQRAMTAEGNTAVYNVNRTHFECTTTTGVGASTRIRISKLRQEIPPQ